MNIEIFATDWYFTLFAKVIPTTQMNAFFDSFFEFGWCFFHKFTITLLRILAPQILRMDDMSEIKQLLLLPKHKQNFYGSNSTSSGVVVVENTDGLSEGSSPFQPSDLADDASTQPQQQRTFLSSIGTFFGFSRSQASQASDSVDPQLQQLLGTATVAELLRKEDAWVLIIDISKRLWGKKLPDSIIKQFLNDYDLLRE